MAHASTEVPLDLNHLAHRRWIGYCGLMLPVLLVVLARLRDDPALPLSHPLDSISAYYHTGAVAAYAGVLFALSGFLLTYRGYSHSRADRGLGIFGGVCALGVAFFPTKPPDGVDGPPWSSATTETIHYTAAAFLFLVFIAFSIWLFRKTNLPKGQELPRAKRVRNRIFLGCGIVMIVSIAWAAIAGRAGRSIFWEEAVALWAFAISWLVKGEIDLAVKRVVGK